LCFALAACTAESTVLDAPEGLVLSCDDAWQAGQPGVPCVLDEGPCDRANPVDPTCCTDYAYCTMDGLVMDTVCDPECACVDDSTCEYGVRICELSTGLCEQCPSPDLCPACPDGWTRLQRNGCETCQCAPPSQCERPGDLCDDQQSWCYPGASCAEMCDAFTPGCCANACSAPGCPEPAPVGCFAECPPELGCQTFCATQSCVCDGAQWTCDAICVEDLSVSCVYP
jgi:hypothetical protein